MDVPVSQAAYWRSESGRAKIAKLARALGYPAEAFYEAELEESLVDTATLLQMWGLIAYPKGRQVVLSCMREVLRTQSDDM